MRMSKPTFCFSALYLYLCKVQRLQQELCQQALINTAVRIACEFAVPSFGHALLCVPCYKSNVVHVCWRSVSPHMLQQRTTRLAGGLFHGGSVFCGKARIRKETCAKPAQLCPVSNSLSLLLRVFCLCVVWLFWRHSVGVHLATRVVIIKALN